MSSPSNRKLICFDVLTLLYILLTLYILYKQSFLEISIHLEHETLSYIVFHDIKTIIPVGTQDDIVCCFTTPCGLAKRMQSRH